jgi:hypothetical protein
MATTPNAGRGLRNPIIADTPGDTLYQVECCLAFIARVHEDLADWQAACAGDEGGPDAMNIDQHRGLALLVECVRAAVLHEMDREDA